MNSILNLNMMNMMNMIKQLLIILVMIQIHVGMLYGADRLSLDQIREKGKKAFQSQKFKEAKTLYLEFVQRSPLAVDEYLDLARAAYASNEYVTAVLAYKFFLDRCKNDQPSHPQIARATNELQEVEKTESNQKIQQKVLEISKQLEIILNAIQQKNLSGENGAFVLWQESQSAGHFAPKFATVLVDKIKTKLLEDQKTLMEIWWDPKKNITRDGAQILKQWEKWANLAIEVNGELQNQNDFLLALIEFQRQNYEKAINLIAKVKDLYQAKYIQLMCLLKLEKYNDAYHLAKTLKADYPKEGKFELIYGLIALKLKKDDAPSALRKGLLDFDEND
jgi:tetratricopeptide (TPR) repeat protein